MQCRLLLVMYFKQHQKQNSDHVRKDLCACTFNLLLTETSHFFPRETVLFIDHMGEIIRTPNGQWQDKFLKARYRDLKQVLSLSLSTVRSHYCLTHFHGLTSWSQQLTHTLYVTWLPLILSRKPSFKMPSTEYSLTIDSRKMFTRCF